jgi:hypothetical protein
MKLRWLLLLCLGLPFWCDAQLETQQPEKRSHLAIQADAFWGFDGLGNYFYSKNNVLFKHHESGILQYQNLPFGKLKSVDITQPLRPILFYENFNAVVVLDNFLNEIQVVEFSNIPTPIMITAVGMANQNRLWGYDAVMQQIGMYHLTTGSFSPIGNPVQGSWKYYQCAFNSLTWVDAQNHWKSITIYGHISDYGQLPEGMYYFVNENVVLLYNHETWTLLNRLTGKKSSFEIVEKSVKNFSCNDQILSIFTAEGITNYKITVP